MRKRHCPPQLLPRFLDRMPSIRLRSIRTRMSIQLASIKPLVKKISFGFDGADTFSTVPVQEGGRRWQAIMKKKHTTSARAGIGLSTQARCSKLNSLALTKHKII